MSKLIPIALLSFFIICPAMAAEIVPIFSNCGTKTCKKEDAEYCAINYDYNGLPNLQNSSCKHCRESLGWGEYTRYSKPSNATDIFWTQETSDAGMTTPYDQDDGCTWHATCNAGEYLYIDSSNYTTTCMACSELGNNFINKAAPSIIDQPDSDPFTVTYYSTRISNDVKVDITDPIWNTTTTQDYKNNQDLTKLIKDYICVTCPEDSLRNSTKDGCYACEEGELVDEEHEECVCRKDGYFKSAQRCLSCGDNATSYKTASANEYAENIGCKCNDTDTYYNLNGFYNDTTSKELVYNNQARKTAACKPRPQITYRATNHDKEPEEVKDKLADPNIGTSGYTTLNTNNENIKKLQQHTGYLIGNWVLDIPHYSVTINDVACRTQKESTDYAPGALISQGTYLSVMMCNKNSDNIPEFILTAKTKPKNVYYRYYTTDSTEQSTCQKDTQVCNENGDSAKCPASEIKCDSIPAGYYFANKRWTLINQNGQFINDNGNVVGTATVTYTPGTHILYPAEDVYLVTQLTKCPVDNYCIGGEMKECPNGTSTNGETGKSSPNDCVINDSWQICAGDYCFRMTEGLKKFTK